MRLSLFAARAQNGVIGDGPKIPWRAKGEQQLFKAFTYNQWLLVGRKTFESMGALPDRKYAVLTRAGGIEEKEGIRVFGSVDAALEGMAVQTDHMIVAGGGEIYRETIGRADTLHLSEIHCQAEGAVVFPEVPADFSVVFSQEFRSNIDYTYRIWRRG